MSQQIYFGGKKFISSKRASELRHYSQDYIGQLIREKKLEARMVGRSWFVCEESILNYDAKPISASRVQEISAPVETPHTAEVFFGLKNKILAAAIAASLTAGGYGLVQMSGKIFEEETSSLAAVGSLAQGSLVTDLAAETAVPAVSAIATTSDAESSPIAPVPETRVYSSALAVTATYSDWATRMDLASIREDMLERIASLNKVASINRRNSQAVVETINLGEIDGAGMNQAVITNSSITGSTFSGTSVNAETLTVTGGAEFGSGSFSRIGVGTSSPWGQFSIQPDGVGPTFVIGSSTRTDFIVTAEGNLGVGTTSPSQALSVSGSTLLHGTTTIASTDGGITFTGSGAHDISAANGTLRIGASTIIGNLEAINDTIDIGTPGIRFDKIYANEVNASTIVGTLTAGNLIADTFSINSDNVTADAENSYISFERGTISPNALLTWNSTTKRFEFNNSLYIEGTASTSLELKGVAGQSHDLFKVSSSTGLSLFNISSGGTVGVGTTTPSSMFSVHGASLLGGNAVVGGNLTATGTLVVNNLDIRNNSNGNIRITSPNNTGFGVTLDGGSTQHFTISSIGNVGIGTTSPYGKLSISSANSTTASPLFVIASSSAAIATSTSFIVTSAGNVGVGTSNPESAFHLSPNTAASGEFRLGSGSTESGGNTYFYMRRTAATSGDIYMDAFRSGVGAADILINSLFNGNVGIGAATEGYKLHVGGSFGIGTGSSGSGNSTYLTINTTASTGGNVRFQTYLAGTGFTNSILLQPDGGNVGIGTTTPDTRLVVSKDANIIGGSGNNAQLRISGSTSGAKRLNIGYDTTADKGYIQAGEDNVSVTALLLNPSGGSVGIGTTSPYGKLSISSANSTTASPLFVIASSSAAVSTSTSFIVTSTGNVGIGTTSPSQGIAGGGTARVLNLSDSSNSILRITGGNVDAIFQTLSNTKAYIGTMTAHALEFDTSGTPRMTILSGGNVGVGTVAPDQLLHVSSASTHARAKVEAPVASGASLILSHTGGQAWEMYAPGSSTDLRFHDGTADRVTIANGGNVGIGTTTPTALLTVGANSAARIDSNELFQFANTSNATTYGTIRSSTVTTYLGATVGTSFIGTSNSAPFAIRTVGADRLTVSTAGAVGIGTSSPNFRGFGGPVLSIGSAAAADPALELGKTITGSDGTLGNIAFINTGVSGESRLATILGLRSGANNSGAFAFYTNSAGSYAERMRLSPSGNLGIGTTSPYAELSVVGSAVAADYHATSLTDGFRADNLLGGATTLSTDANGNIIRTPSDANLKENVQDLVGSLDRLKNLRGVSYEWKDKERFGEATDIGFIAQEVEAVVPEVVKSGGAYKSLNYGNLVALVVEAVKELSAKLDLLEASLQNVLANVTEMIVETFSANIAYIHSATIDTLNAGEITVGSEMKSGITLYDEVTHAPYCLKIFNGQTMAFTGACGATTQVVEQPAEPAEPEPAPEPISEPEPELTPAPEPDSEPEVVEPTEAVVDEPIEEPVVETPVETIPASTEGESENQPAI